MSSLSLPNYSDSTTAHLTKLQSKVQVWIKPTDRILTEADAFEFDHYRSQKTKQHISSQWFILLCLFAFPAIGFTYYTCWLAISGELSRMLGRFSVSSSVGGGDREREWERLKGLGSVVVFHLGIVPVGVMLGAGNWEVRKACARIVGYCLLAMAVAGVWAAVVFG